MQKRSDAYKNEEMRRKNVEKRTNHKKITKDYMKRGISKRTKTYRLKRDSVTWP